MGDRRKPSGLVGVGYVLALMGFAGALVSASGVVVNTLVLPLAIDDHTITIHTDIPSAAVDPPPNAELERTVPVRVPLEDATLGEGAAALGAVAIPLAMAIIVSFLMLRIADSVRRGDPFNTPNVRRLRIIGFTLLIGGPLGDFFGQTIGQGLAESAGVSSPGFVLDIPGTLPLAGVGVLILSEVFRHGVRLREDVEATI